jgi:hypothetical protein
LIKTHDGAREPKLARTCDVDRCRPHGLTDRDKRSWQQSCSTDRHSHGAQMRPTASHPGTRLLSVRQAATEFGIPRGTLTKLLERGVLRPVRLPRIRRTWVDRNDVEALLINSKEVAS